MNYESPCQKKVIVTGVTGQDGSLLADFLINNTECIVLGAVRRLSVPNHRNIEHLLGHDRFKLIDLDVSDPVSVTHTIRKYLPDYYFNFAANSFVGTSWDMPVNHMQTNCMGVLYALEAIRNHCPSSRFYNAGSSEEFGDVIRVPQDETHPLRPRSPYGASKASARHLVKVYRESYDMYAVQGWLFNHEGVRRGEEFVTRKISKGVARIGVALELHKPFEPIKLGNVDSKRDWSDAEDFVRAVWMMLNQEIYWQKSFDDWDGPKDYVVSSNETHTIREFVELAFKSINIDGKWIGSGYDTAFIHDNKILVQVDEKFYRPAEVDVLHGDSSLIREELGWQPDYSFYDLVRKMVLKDFRDAATPNLL